MGAGRRRGGAKPQSNRQPVDDNNRLLNIDDSFGGQTLPVGVGYDHLGAARVGRRTYTAATRAAEALVYCR